MTLARSFLRFLQVGALSFVFGLAMTAGLHELAGLTEEAAFGVSLATVFFTNFVLLRFWAFDARQGHAGIQLVRFLAGSLLFRASEYCIFLLLHTLADTYYLIAAVLAQTASALAKFFLYRRLVFDITEESAESRGRERLRS